MYTINAKAEGLWQIKTVIKTEAQPRFLWAVFICHKPEAEAFIVFRFNLEILGITILTFKLFFLYTYSCKRQMTTHLHTRYRPSDVEAAKTWVNAVHTFAWYKISRRMRKHSLSFLISTRMRRHARSFHHVVEVVDWHFRADDVSSKEDFPCPFFFCLQRRETWETSLHDAWAFRRVARMASFQPWSCRCHARGLENMFHPFFGAIDGNVLQS